MPLPPEECVLCRFTLASLAIASVLCAGCARQQPLNVTASEVLKHDVGEIYEAFLDQWAGKEKKPLNVSIRAKAPESEGAKEIADCAQSKSRWLPAQSIDDLTPVLGQLAYVRLTNPDEWSPSDPGELIAQGNSVESSVESGFSNGLMALSAITFDESHETAAFSYSFVCGALCGNGGTVIFKKTRSGWAPSEKNCGSWMS